MAMPVQSKTSVGDDGGQGKREVIQRRELHLPGTTFLPRFLALASDHLDSHGNTVTHGKDVSDLPYRTDPRTAGANLAEIM